MTLHILHISHAMNTGLAHRIAGYARQHIQQGARVSMACPNSRLAVLATDAGAHYVPWGAEPSAGPSLPMHARRLRNLIEQVNPDVVHLHGSRAGLVGRTALRGSIPTIFSPYGWSFLGAKGFRQRQAREWERMAARWSTVTVCVSHGEAATGRRAGVRGRFEIVPHQLDMQTIDELTMMNRASVRASLGASAGQPLVVCAARLCDQKGQDIAVAAWPLVREEIPNAELVLVGDGPLRSALQTAATPGVNLLGSLERELALKWMYAADVVICPSRWEAASLATMEAMALGRPVVASAVDGAREQLNEDVGRIVPPEYPRALAAAITQLLANPVVAMDAGFQARKLAYERDSRTDSAGRLWQLYQQAAALKRV